MEELFCSKLKNIINLRHELVRLGELIDWGRLEVHFASYDSEAGRPGLPIRLVVGLHPKLGGKLGWFGSASYEALRVKQISDIELGWTLLQDAFCLTVVHHDEAGLPSEPQEFKLKPALRLLMNREKRGAIEWPIRISLNSRLFLFNVLALPRIPPNSLKFRPVVFSIYTAYRISCEPQPHCVEI